MGIETLDWRRGDAFGGSKGSVAEVVAHGGGWLQFGDEFVVDGFVGLEAAIGVPAQAAHDEVEEDFVVTFQNL